MGGDYTLNATVPVPAGTTLEEIANWCQKITEEDDFDFSVPMITDLMLEFAAEPVYFSFCPTDKERTRLNVNVEGEMGYGDMCMHDELCKALYKQHGDHTRVMEADTTCDGEEARHLMAPQKVLIAFQREEAEEQIKTAQAWIAELDLKALSAGEIGK